MLFQYTLNNTSHTVFRLVLVIFYSYKFIRLNFNLPIYNGQKHCYRFEIIKVIFFETTYISLFY